ncbi:hypothetical protein ETB97_008632 [Aspergillus alliaceus]|uniref:Uncharacterized protein n=1 Tax=Petromyces alliaceus TaxID=209559 RepID=A0A8H6ACD0_PETAA|nr:hypothetical protein ETB97_008632 [Aspergillus burnettii]
MAYEYYGFLVVLPVLKHMLICSRVIRTILTENHTSRTNISNTNTNRPFERPMTRQELEGLFAHLLARTPANLNPTLSIGDQALSLKSLVQDAAPYKAAGPSLNAAMFQGHSAVYAAIANGLMLLVSALYEMNPEEGEAPENPIILDGEDRDKNNLIVL